jgi:hypothetical protein
MCPTFISAPNDGYLESVSKSTTDQVVCGVYMSSQSVLHETMNL